MIFARQGLKTEISSQLPGMRRLAGSALSRRDQPVRCRCVDRRNLRPTVTYSSRNASCMPIFRCFCTARPSSSRGVAQTRLTAAPSSSSVCARLPHLYDAVGKTELGLTHDFPSQMLAVRRPCVRARSALEKLKLIVHRYGKIRYRQTVGGGPALLSNGQGRSTSCSLGKNRVERIRRCALDPARSRSASWPSIVDLFVRDALRLAAGAFFLASVSLRVTAYPRRFLTRSGLITVLSRAAAVSAMSSSPHGALVSPPVAQSASLSPPIS